MGATVSGRIEDEGERRWGRWWICWSCGWLVEGLDGRDRGGRRLLMMEEEEVVGSGDLLG